MSTAQLVSTGPLILALPVAAAAGAVTFLSPCCLPLVPGYLSFVTGMAGAGGAAPGPAPAAVVATGGAATTTPAPSAAAAGAAGGTGPGADPPAPAMPVTKDR